MSPYVLSTAIMLAAVFFMLASFWRIYAKAGEAGWKCLVPLYGAVVYLRITGRPWWWLVLLCIPGVNLIPAIVSCFDLARVFGKGPGFGWGVLLLGPIFVAVLGFGGAEYVGPAKLPAMPMRRAA